MKKGLSWIRVLGPVVITLTVVSLCGNSSFATTWQEEGMCVSDGDYWNPEVVELANGQYRMYYEYEVEGEQRSIYSLISSDGLTWESESGTRVSEANMPSIVQLADGQWRIYYSAKGQDGFGSAISDDGLNFTKEDGLRLTPSGEGYEAYGIRHPTVIKLDDGTFRMYYDASQASENQVRILSAISSDGLTWEKEDGVRIDYSSFANCDSITTPDVIKTSDGYTRLYFGVRGLMDIEKSGIYLAVSTDGLNFSIREGPEMPGFEADGVAYGAMDASVVSISTGLRMYYWIGTAETLPLSAIYSATASLEFGEESEDGEDDDDEDGDGEDDDDEDGDGEDDEDSDSGGGGCFIATACYGSSMAPEVLSLKQFRDEYLVTNRAGKVFVKTYCALSPHSARFIARHPVLRAIVRAQLKPIIKISGMLAEE